MRPPPPRGSPVAAEMRFRDLRSASNSAPRSANASNQLRWNLLAACLVHETSESRIDRLGVFAKALLGLGNRGPKDNRQRKKSFRYGGASNRHRQSVSRWAFSH